jgi:rSAM/selenodomain-associated transferase 1
VSAEPVDIAVFAKAPEAGIAKTRLIPALGARGAARLQRWLTQRAVGTARQAGTGAVSLWCAPDARHRFFRAMRRYAEIECDAQRGADLGQRMLHTFEVHDATRPLLLIGTDCPALTPDDLRMAARALRDGGDAVVLPAEDGGYVLIGLRRPIPRLFEGIAWGTGSVMERTRARLQAAGVRWSELRLLWDVDRPADLCRLLSLCPGDARLRRIAGAQAATHPWTGNGGLAGAPGTATHGSAG